jgi:hypothetical protein
MVETSESAKQSCLQALSSPSAHRVPTPFSEGRTNFDTPGTSIC